MFMKTKMILAGLITAFLMTVAVHDAEAHRWRRRAICRPARVVVASPVIVPRVVVPPPVRVVRRDCGPRVYIHTPRRVHRHHRYGW